VRDGAGQSPVPEPEPLMQSFMLPPGGGDARNYIYQYDAGGNVGQMLDLTPTTWNAAAVMVARYDYDAYGKVVAQAGSFANQATNGNAFQFNTKYLDAETGLNYYGHRYYSARLGRWTTRDPLGEAGGLNLYGFVGNDPVNGIDPLGLAVMDYLAPPLDDVVRWWWWDGLGLRTRVKGWTGGDLLDTIAVAQDRWFLAHLVGDESEVANIEERIDIMRDQLLFLYKMEEAPEQRGRITDIKYADARCASENAWLHLREHRDREFEAAVYEAWWGVLGTLNEPADWVLTAQAAIDRGSVETTDLLVCLPFVSGQAAKRIAGTFRAGRRLEDCTDLARIRATPGQKEAYEAFLKALGDFGAGVRRAFNGTPHKFVLPKDLYLVRYTTAVEDVPSRWFSPVRVATQNDAQRLLALPKKNTAAVETVWRVPKGKEVWIGIAADMSEYQDEFDKMATGGGLQVYVGDLSGLTKCAEQRMPR